MATVQMAHFKGREVGVRVHESPLVSSAAVSVDLYHFEGDGLPVCEGLKPCTVRLEDGRAAAGNVFCMCYDPDSCLVFEFEPDGEGGDIDLMPEWLPLATLKNVAAWLEKAVQPDYVKALLEEMLRKDMDIHSIAAVAVAVSHYVERKQHCDKIMMPDNPVQQLPNRDRVISFHKKHLETVMADLERELIDNGIESVGINMINSQI
jgi:hypothetical protein